MPSTDIDGSPIVILSALEAERMYEYLFEVSLVRKLDLLEVQLAGRIAASLDFAPLENRSVNERELREIERLRAENFRLQHELDRVGMPAAPATQPGED
jgi:hypothetical protein